MDWIDEKLKLIRIKLKNLSLKKAMTAYLLIFIVITFILSLITMGLCDRWSNLVWIKYDLSPYTSITFGASLLTDNDHFMILLLNSIKLWCPYLYAVISMVAVSSLFYKNRLKIPFDILEKGVKKIKKNELDYQIRYDSQDELGRLSELFEEMRVELIRNKESMWELVAEKQRLNAAFAHDLRTPLTVLRGYVDILLKFSPEGKISQEKLMDTLLIMSSHITRLEHYSNTMKNIHSLEDMPVQKIQTTLLSVHEKITGIIYALNQSDMIAIEMKEPLNLSADIWIDENILLEVLENLFSNAIRYANKRVDVSIEINFESESLILYVADDGQGFSNEDLIKALNPYYREKTTENMNHFGIGLHICNTLCAKHGGFINLSNSIDTGAIVSASFSYKES